MCVTQVFNWPGCLMFTILTAGFLQHNGCRLVSTCNVKESDDTHLDLQILKSRFEVGCLADGDLLQQELHLLSCFS